MAECHPSTSDGEVLTNVMGFSSPKLNHLQSQFNRQRSKSVVAKMANTNFGIRRKGTRKGRLNASLKNDGGLKKFQRQMEGLEETRGDYLPLSVPFNFH